MEEIKQKISLLHQEFNTALTTAATEQALETVRIAFLGRSGTISTLMASLKNLSLEEKREFGPLCNELKKNAEYAFELKKKQLQENAAHAQALQKQYFDVTASHYQPLRGKTHLYTTLFSQFQDIFISMGWHIADGPEVETDYYNFTALNIPDEHPAREMHDTFWLDVPGMLMRTHTSTVQIHTMKKKELPLAVFAPGRCYRNEATDASHDFMFTQGEGLVIDKNISIANLLAIAQTFLQEFFEKKDLKIRARPGYFPFVEPAIEIDASCPFCKNGCSVCKKTTWIELLGSGLVHPNVLRHGNINPDLYRGCAFGFGMERLAMVKYGINDIRLFHSSKLQFLDQF
jgi:phenylalanyl-tRNA synthetase alpha chain